jgi:hypothetical protein
MSKGIYTAYQLAGQEFLAYRLGKLFVKIETPEDMALHNDVLAEVLQIIQGEEQSFFTDMAHIILYVKKDLCPQCSKEPKKRLLFRVAGKILELGQKG